MEEIKQELFALRNKVEQLEKGHGASDDQKNLLKEELINKKLYNLRLTLGEERNDIVLKLKERENLLLENKNLRKANEQVNYRVGILIRALNEAEAKLKENNISL